MRTAVGVFHRCAERQFLPAGGRCNRLQEEIALRAGGVPDLRKLRVLSMTTVRHPANWRIEQCEDERRP